LMNILSYKRIWLLGILLNYLNYYLCHSLNMLINHKKIYKLSFFIVFILTFVVLKPSKVLSYSCGEGLYCTHTNQYYEGWYRLARDPPVYFECRKDVPNTYYSCSGSDSDCSGGFYRYPSYDHCMTGEKYTYKGCCIKEGGDPDPDPDPTYGFFEGVIWSDDNSSGPTWWPEDGEDFKVNSSLSCSDKYHAGFKITYLGNFK